MSFIEQLKNGKGIVRKILAVSTTGILLCLLAAQLEVPQWFAVQWAGMVGFYFGGELGAQKPEG